MSPEEARRALSRLRDMLEERGLAWLVRRTDEVYEEGRRPTTLADEASQRLVLLVDACVDVLRMTATLRAAVPPLLLTDTRAAEVFLARPDPDSDDVVDSTRISAPDVDEQRQLEELLVALAELGRRAVEDLG